MGNKNKVEFNAPQYEPNMSYFEAIMHNISLIDNVISGAEGYIATDKGSVIHSLVDVLIAKVLNEDKMNDLIAHKKRLLEDVSKTDWSLIKKNDAIMTANITIYGECLKYFAKYLTWETRLAVMKS